MSKLPYRQIHLDFHTSECIEGIGSRFTKENFAKALKEGPVSSITLFSKCHHGWSYHPTEANEIHPHLNFDLLGAQLEVCRELGIRTQIYISAGFDEKYAKTHLDCLQRDINGNYSPFDAPCSVTEVTSIAVLPSRGSTFSGRVSSNPVTSVATAVVLPSVVTASINDTVYPRQY